MFKFRLENVQNRKFISKMGERNIDIIDIKGEHMPEVFLHKMM